jgi:hypothetical protein
MHYDVTLLSNEDVCAQYRREIGALTANYGSANEQRHALRDGICQAGANNLLLQREIHRGHSWWTAEALQAINAKGAAWLACKGGEVLDTAEARTRYATLKNLARRLVRRDRRTHLEAHAKRVEEAFRDHKWHDAYKHPKTLGADQEISLTTIKDSEGNVITDPETTHAAWKEFFEVLLNRRRDIPEGVHEDLKYRPYGGDASHS